MKDCTSQTDPKNKVEINPCIISKLLVFMLMMGCSAAFTHVASASGCSKEKLKKSRNNLESCSKVQAAVDQVDSETFKSKFLHNSVLYSDQNKPAIDFSMASNSFLKKLHLFIFSGLSPPA